MTSLRHISAPVNPVWQILRFLIRNNLYWFTDNVIQQLIPSLEMPGVFRKSSILTITVRFSVMITRNCGTVQRSDVSGRLFGHVQSAFKRRFAASQAVRGATKLFSASTLLHPDWFIWFPNANVWFVVLVRYLAIGHEQINSCFKLRFSGTAL